MNKVLTERIYTTIAGLVVGALAGFVLKKGWKLATGAEPPDPNDPEVPAKAALIWFAISTLTVGVVQLVAARSTKRAALQRGRSSQT